MEPIRDFLLYIPGLLLAFCFHEFAHAWVAVRQGDDTPLRDGRVTLDPRAHIDPIGSILFPAIASLSGAPLLGWARPVMTNTRKYRNYRLGDIKVSLAGVTANLLLAIVFGVLTAVLSPYLQGSEGTLYTLAMMCEYAVLVNVGLMIFNLLPVPPLDGSNVLYHFLPPAAGAQLRALRPYGFIILYALMFTGVLRVMTPLIFGITAGLIGIPALLIYG
jgi:Zn-dependent protease